MKPGKQRAAALRGLYYAGVPYDIIGYCLGMSLKQVRSAIASGRLRVEMREAARDYASAKFVEGSTDGEVAKWCVPPMTVTKWRAINKEKMRKAKAIFAKADRARFTKRRPLDLRAEMTARADDFKGIA